MTREEALKKVRGYLTDYLPLEDVDEIDEIIEALEQQTCDDAISRREAIKMFTYNYKGERIPDFDLDNFPNKIYIKTVKEMLRGLPPVTPQPKIGRWEWVQYDGNPNIGNWHCTECKNIVIKGVKKEKKEVIFPLYTYCPNCGTKMEEVNK